MINSADSGDSGAYFVQLPQLQRTISKLVNNLTEQKLRAQQLQECLVAPRLSISSPMTLQSYQNGNEITAH